MQLEKQVCNLELSKRLKELGVKQDGYFEWSYWMDHPPHEAMDHQCQEKHWQVTDRIGGNFGERHSAFTVGELGEMLPRDFYTMRDIVGAWDCASKNIGGKWVTQSAPTEADARAKALIYLIENRLVKP